MKKSDLALGRVYMFESGCVVRVVGIHDSTRPDGTPLRKVSWDAVDPGDPSNGCCRDRTFLNRAVVQIDLYDLGERSLGWKSGAGCYRLKIGGRYAQAGLDPVNGLYCWALYDEGGPVGVAGAARTHKGALLAAQSALFCVVDEINSSGA